MIPEQLIPIILFLVIGAVTISFIYFRSKEKQMMIEKGLTLEEMKELLAKRSRPYLLLQLGIISVGIGVGLGLGFLFGVEEYIAVFILIFLGVSAIMASLYTKKLIDEDGNN